MDGKYTIGILGFQGSVIEHQRMLEKLGQNVKIIKYLDDLENIDGIILPGGESTTISKLLKVFGLFDVLREKIANGLPVYGTCAGLILLAKKIVSEDCHLATMNIVVQRNAFGSQLDSFEIEENIPSFSSNKIPLVFIRAPWIESAGASVEVLAKYNDKIICAREKNMLVSSFHPELTNDLSVHKYFIDMIQNKGE